MKSQTVILLHGVAKTKHCMHKLAKQLQVQGYCVINQSYPSFSDTLPDLAEKTIARLLAECPSDHLVHFVTHSMGGILVRCYLAKHKVHNLGRVVMLGPPNQGSPLVDILEKLDNKHHFSTQPIMQLGTHRNGFTQQIGNANFELGIIAGKRSVNPILSLFLAGRDDGKVSVENTKLAGMKAHLTLPVTHPFMMKNPKVIQHVLSFLANGHFVASNNKNRVLLD